MSVTPAMLQDFCSQVPLNARAKSPFQLQGARSPARPQARAASAPHRCAGSPAPRSPSAQRSAGRASWRAAPALPAYTHFSLARERHSLDLLLLKLVCCKGNKGGAMAWPHCKRYSCTRFDYRQGIGEVWAGRHKTSVELQHHEKNAHLGLECIRDAHLGFGKRALAHEHDLPIRLQRLLVLLPVIQLPLQRLAQPGKPHQRVMASWVSQGAQARHLAEAARCDKSQGTHTRASTTPSA